MPGDEDGVVLSDREREVLAGLAATLDDPWLAEQLRGTDGPPPLAPAPPFQMPVQLPIQLPAVPARRRKASRRPRRAPPKRLHRWAGVVLIVLGILIHLATFTFSPWMAAAQFGVMAAGTWLLWHDRIPLGRRREKPPGGRAGP